MNKLTLIAALIATTLSSAAVASDWVFLGVSPKGKAYYIDRESIRTQPNGYKRAWTRAIYEEPNEYGGTSDETLEEYDCRERRSRFLQFTFFKGDEVSDSVKLPTDWDYASPDSLGEYELEFVCFGTLPE